MHGDTEGRQKTLGEALSLPANYKHLDSASRRGPTNDEIYAAIQTMRNHAIRKLGIALSPPVAASATRSVLIAEYKKLYRTEATSSARKASFHYGNPDRVQPSRRTKSSHDFKAHSRRVSDTGPTTTAHLKRAQTAWRTRRSLDGPTRYTSAAAAWAQRDVDDGLPGSFISPEQTRKPQRRSQAGLVDELEKQKAELEAKLAALEEEKAAQEASQQHTIEQLRLQVEESEQKDRKASKHRRKGRKKQAKGKVAPSVAAISEDATTESPATRALREKLAQAELEVERQRQDRLLLQQQMIQLKQEKEAAEQEAWRSAERGSKIRQAMMQTAEREAARRRPLVGDSDDDSDAEFDTARDPHAIDTPRDLHTPQPPYARRPNYAGVKLSPLVNALTDYSAGSSGSPPTEIIKGRGKYDHLDLAGSQRTLYFHAKRPEGKASSHRGLKFEQARFTGGSRHSPAKHDSLSPGSGTGQHTPTKDVTPHNLPKLPTQYTCRQKAVRIVCCCPGRSKASWALRITAWAAVIAGAITAIIVASLDSEPDATAAVCFEAGYTTEFSDSSSQALALPGLCRDAPLVPGATIALSGHPVLFDPATIDATVFTFSNNTLTVKDGIAQTAAYNAYGALRYDPISDQLVVGESQALAVTITSAGQSDTASLEISAINDAPIFVYDAVTTGRGPDTTVASGFSNIALADVAQMLSDPDVSQGQRLGVFFPETALYAFLADQLKAEAGTPKRLYVNEDGVITNWDGFANQAAAEAHLNFLGYQKNLDGDWLPIQGWFATEGLIFVQVNLAGAVSDWGPFSDEASARQFLIDSNLQNADGSLNPGCYLVGESTRLAIAAKRAGNYQAKPNL